MCGIKALYVGFFVKPTRKFIFKRKLYNTWCKCRVKEVVIFNQTNQSTPSRQFLVYNLNLKFTVGQKGTPIYNRPPYHKLVRSNQKGKQV